MPPSRPSPKTALIIFSVFSILNISTPTLFPAPAPTLFDVRTFGATGDGKTLDTQSLQSAIDACHHAGGGTVLIAGGRYLTGTLYLKSNVCLRIESGGTILGSTRIADYTTDTDRTMYKGEPYMDRCLIFAKDASNISIEGAGAIDGQGHAFPEKGDARKNRPKMIRLMNCARVRIRDVTLQAPASWTTEWRYCDDIAVDGITIRARANGNGDGLDFDGCTRVRVSNSTFDTSDDSICLQTSLADKPCRDIVITNCNFSSRWAGIRIGLLSRADFENVTVTGCTFRDHNDSGLKIQMNEGAEMKNMVFSNLVMKNVPRPVFLTFCQKNAWVDSTGELPPMKRLGGLLFSNIIVDSADITGPAAVTCGFQITGMPGHAIEDIVFTDIIATFPGGGTAGHAKTVLAEFTPDVLQNRWPEYSRFGGTVPSFGFYARHVDGITLRNVQLRTKDRDARPAVVFVNVKNARITDAPAPVRNETRPAPTAASAMPGRGISGPGATRSGRWESMNEKTTASAVKSGLIPDLKPLIPNMQIRDTVVILGGDGNYYLTGSSGDDIWDHNDGVELWRSSDLIKWDYVGLVWSFEKDATWQKEWRWHRKPVRALWAPELHYIKRLNNYFITLSMPPGGRGILKSTTGKPEGPYVNALANDAMLPGNIDASLFEDDDGAVYLVYGGGSIARMNDDLSALAENVRHPVLKNPDTDPRRHAASCSQRRDCSDIGHEGAFLFKRDGKYYFTAADSCEGRYSSMAAISNNVYGPYEHRHEAVPTGGGTNYFQDRQGRWWCGYFGNDNQAPFREKPAIVRVEFAPDGKIRVAKDQPGFVLDSRP